MAQPLAGVRVLELATGVPGPFAGKLFADFGADVVKVEPPAGDEARLLGPFPDGDGGPEQSALFLHLNTNKRSTVLDVAGSADDRARLLELAGQADLLIESFAPGALEGWGIGPERLRQANPRLVVCRVTPFGQDGPYAHHPAAEIVLYALAGPMSATGVAEREPMKLAGQVVQYQCGNVAAMACLAALRRAEACGAGATIDVANLQTQLGSIDRRVTYLLWQAWSGLAAPRPPSFPQNPLPSGVFPTADGYVQILTVANWVPGMTTALGEAALSERYASADWLADLTLPGDTEAAMYPWLLARSKAEAMQEAQAHRWPITAVNTPLEVLDDPHFAQRGFFVEVDHPVAGRYRAPGPPWRMADGWRLRRPAPTLGEAGRGAFEPRRVPSGPPAPSLPTAGTDRLPLEGVRVLDLTVVWAGPYCTMLLADLGAEVIRVDNASVFPTATRGAMPRPPRDRIAAMGPLGGAYPDMDPGERPWNRHGMYAAQARGKLGVTLDLRTTLGRETFLRLAERSDVFVENNSARVLDHLGIGWDVLHARNPRLIVVRMAPLGLTGPYRDYIGFGAHFEALCGFTATRGYRDADPTLTWNTFHMDPATGAAGAFAVMAALRQREATGEGQLIEFAQAENMAQHLGELYVDAARTGRVHGPSGNRDPNRVPQGCYPCRGDDAWVAISAGDDGWDGLARLIGRDEWAGLSRAQRADRHDELDAAIAVWTGGLDGPAVAAACRDCGVAAAPVLDEAGCYADAHLRARRAFRFNGSNDVPPTEFPDHVFRWDGPPLRWGPLCRLGADNDHVYRDVLGLSDAEMAALHAEGHLSLDYLKPDGTPW